MPWRQVARSFAKPALGTLRYVITLALFCWLWWWDARYLNQAFDANLALLKSVSAAVDGSGKAEAMLRAFSAEKMLLFAEGSGLLWLSGAVVSSIAVRLLRSRMAATNAPPARPAGDRRR